MKCSWLSKFDLRIFNKKAYLIIVRIAKANKHLCSIPPIWRRKSRTWPLLISIFPGPFAPVYRSHCHGIWIHL